MKVVRLTIGIVWSLGIVAMSTVAGEEREAWGELVRAGAVPVDARLVGHDPQADGVARFRFATETGTLVVDVDALVRFGRRPAPRGGTVVGLRDRSLIACDRAILEGGTVRLAGGLFHDVVLPNRTVAFIVRRFPYDVVAGDRLIEQLEQLRGPEDAVLTMRGDVQRGVVRDVEGELSVRVGIDPLPWFDAKGKGRTTEAETLRAILFGQSRPARGGDDAAATGFAVAWHDGSYLASAGLDDAGSVHAMTIKTLATSSPFQAIAFLQASPAALARRGVTMLAQQQAARYRATSLLWGPQPPKALPQEGNDVLHDDTSLFGLPRRVDGFHYPQAVTPAPVSTFVYIVPPGAVLKGALAVWDPPHLDRGDPDGAAPGLLRRCAVQVFAGATSETLTLQYESGPIDASDGARSFSIPLHDARIVIFQVESSTPTVSPGLLDLRIEVEPGA